MEAEQADVVVIGMGPGGEYLAGRLAEAGLSVVGVEDRLVGGECPYWGCVPSKMMIRAANLLAEGRRIPGMAGSAEVGPDWAPVAQRIRKEATDNWDDTVAVNRFVAKGGRFARGSGRITAPGEVTVTSPDGAAPRVFRASRGIVINAGTEPDIPPIDGLAGTPYWTNREAIETEQVPRSLVVLGGGAIGAELSQVFARFGATVTVIEDDAPAAAAGRAGVQRADRENLHRRGNRDPHRRQCPAGQPRRHLLHRRSRRPRHHRRPVAGRHRPAHPPGRTRHRGGRPERARTDDQRR